jgi:hypothetical protein
VRTGSIERQSVSVSGNVALYNSPQGEASPCQIVFVFSGRFAEVSQFGECGTFGAGVSAAGRYKRTATGQYRK